MFILLHFYAELYRIPTAGIAVAAETCPAIGSREDLQARGFVIVPWAVELVISVGFQVVVA